MLKLELEKYRWNLDNVEINDCNYFANSAEVEISNTLTLTEDDYILDYGNLIYKFEQIQDDNNALYYEMPNINIKLSGIYNNNYLQDFFGFHTKQASIYKIKYYVNLYYNDVLKLKGIISQDSLKIKFNIESNSEQIECIITSLENEFAEYYKTVSVPMINFDTVVGGLDTNKPAISFKNAIERIFNLPCELNLKYNFKISWYGLFYRRFIAGNVFAFIKSGYVNAFQNGVMCYDLLDKICKGFGWRWLLTPDVKIQISERNFESEDLNTTEIENYTIIDQENSFRNLNGNLNNILFRGGYQYGGNNTKCTGIARGEGAMRIGKYDSETRTNYFKKIDMSGFSMVADTGIGYKFNRKNSDFDSENEYRLTEINYEDRDVLKDTFNKLNGDLDYNFHYSSPFGGHLSSYYQGTKRFIQDPLHEATEMYYRKSRYLMFFIPNYVNIMEWDKEYYFTANVFIPIGNTLKVNLINMRTGATNELYTKTSGIETSYPISFSFNAFDYWADTYKLEFKVLKSSGVTVGAGFNNVRIYRHAIRELDIIPLRYQKKDTMLIDCGYMEHFGTKVNFVNQNTYEWDINRTDLTFDDNDLFFNGTFAHLLFTDSYSATQKNWVTGFPYEGYKVKADFEFFLRNGYVINNYRDLFLGSESLNKLDIEVSGIVDNLNDKIKFIGTDDALVGTKWKILECEIDYYNEKTKLKLLRL